MKTMGLLFILILGLRSSGIAQNNATVHKVAFGIYECLNVNQLPEPFLLAVKKQVCNLKKYRGSDHRLCPYDRISDGRNRLQKACPNR